MAQVYGYARVSTRNQKLDRQITNITTAHPDAHMVADKFTGTKMDRPEWNKLMRVVKPGDTIVFDSVSRMSRNAQDGIKTYFELMDRGITLVFLKEPAISTQTYQSAIQEAIPMTGTDVDLILTGVNEFLKKLASKQIELAFEQAQKEVDDLHQRVHEGMVEARKNGKQIGQQTGRKLIVKKADPAKAQIKKLYRKFDGTNTAEETMKIVGIAKNTFFKYVKELEVAAEYENIYSNTTEIIEI